MFGYYYNKSLRKLVVGFGTLFNNIYVAHQNASGPKTTLRVPITYASQEKFIQRLLNPSSITDGTRIENQLPRLSFHINSIVSDASRRRARFASSVALPASGDSCNNQGTQIANEVPVNVGFNLFIYTRHIDDMLQIVEQIMPYFVPDHIIKMSLVDTDPNGPDQMFNIPIVMVSNNLTDRYEGDFNGRRIHIASFSFLAKSYIFGNISNVTTINTSDDNTVVLD